MDGLEKKLLRRQRRHWHIRKKVFGSAEMPRLSVCRSHKHLQVQIIDDLQGKTLCALSTLAPEIRGGVKKGGNIAAAKEVGKRLAELALSKGIQKVVFDRGRFPYHGRIKALALSLREAGLKF